MTAYTLQNLAEELKGVTFVNWLVAVGDHVHCGDDLCEVVTDKASLVLSVPANGKITSLLVQKDDVLENDTVLLTMDLAS